MHRGSHHSMPRHRPSHSFHHSGPRYFQQPSYSYPQYYYDTPYYMEPSPVIVMREESPIVVPVVPPTDQPQQPTTPPQTFSPEKIGYVVLAVVLFLVLLWTVYWFMRK